jgi:hypothetical protein
VDAFANDVRKVIHHKVEAKGRMVSFSID